MSLKDKWPEIRFWMCIVLIFINITLISIPQFAPWAPVFLLNGLMSALGAITSYFSFKK